MKHKRLFLIIVILHSIQCFGQQVQFNNRLAFVIDSLKKEEPTRSAFDMAATEKVASRVAKKNFLLIKKILEKYGFPGYDMVGQKSSDNYCLLVMHSEFALDFQKKALDLLAIQVKNGNANSRSLASLSDIININNGREQLYGTQLEVKDGAYRPKHLADPKNVDERRKTVGIGSLAGYLHDLNAFYNTYKNGPWLNGQISIKKDTLNH